RRQRARLGPKVAEKQERADEKERDGKDRLLVDAAREERREQQRRPILRHPPYEHEQDRLEDQGQESSGRDLQQPRVERKPAGVAAHLPGRVAGLRRAVLEEVAALRDAQVEVRVPADPGLEPQRIHARPQRRRRRHRARGEQCEQRLSHRLIESRNSLFVFVPRILESRNSIESMVFSGCRSCRRIQTRLSCFSSIRSSSLRVPDRLMSRHGKTRFSISLRSRMISELPVPLNSSKITSSMREPVSTSAVPMMVNEPPSSQLRAAPKNRLGRWSALESTPPERILPEGGTTEL